MPAPVPRLRPDEGEGGPGATLLARAMGAAIRGGTAVPPALLLLLLAAVALRAWMWVVYSPSVLNLNDAAVYADLAGGDLFSDATRSAGYPLFLRAVHVVSSQLEVTIALQHLLGIAAGVLLYALVRRLGAPMWVGLCAAAAVLLPIDQIFLEHALMTEAPFTLLLVAATYAAVRAIDPGRAIWRELSSRHLWIAFAALLLAGSVWVRTAGLVLIPLLVVWATVALGGPWRARLAHGGVVAGVAGMALVGYAILQDSETGDLGLSRVSGWALYSRTAPFADCAQFEPPDRTRALCETTPIAERPGPDFYGQYPESPARELFGGPPNGDQELGEFARRAVVAQPIEYAKDVGRDFVRYFEPTFEPQDYSGVGYEVIDVARRAEGIEELVAQQLNAYYADDSYRIDGGVETVSEVQDVLRVHPKLILICLIAAVAGLVAASGRVRSGLALVLGFALLLLIAPVATAIWSARYAIPADGFIVAAGALGAWSVAEKALDRAPARRWARAANR